MIRSSILTEFIFWGVWLVIPLCWELSGGLSSVLFILFKSVIKVNTALVHYPMVTLIIPVFNSGNTLGKCLESVALQDYPPERLEVFLIDNGSRDDSFSIFEDFQGRNPQIRLWWYQSNQGKSKALNKGVFSGSGKYIVNIDSDGWLDPKALSSITARFEADERICGLTGVVITDHEKISQTGDFFMKTLKLCELFEYVESFLVGRSFQSAFNTMHTMAGAFSCFRREALMKTQLYNSETLGEDAHMTRQIREFAGGRIALCENAFFFTEPIESLDKLYVQRQRWQRAEIEVANLFEKRHLGGLFSFFIKPAMRQMISDHTLTFPRLIWLFAIVYLYFAGYPLSLIVGANLLLYSAYVLCSFLYMGAASLYLKEQKKIRGYIFGRWYICLILPFYRVMTYFMRVAGIINSVTTGSKWKTKSLSEETIEIREGMRSQLRKRTGFVRNLAKHINKEG